MKKNRRWEIALCERGTVHVHYGTGSLHILKEDFVDLAGELQQLANRLDVPSQDTKLITRKDSCISYV
jgi:hypothetical protein